LAGEKKDLMIQALSLPYLISSQISTRGWPSDFRPHFKKWFDILEVYKHKRKA